ncbi:hypothetical protein NC653_027111 [Populus alba x Populus x berolinensis]|uniref:Uncharacterized protein n=1 Tax=Populus alba x Populus x berolinensis TaxID=444605 RepID=A0AAD6M5C4_9ROSI|nr:hypothetical protein NC653_027111 [Populus alba x Populus x berolinensis]
MSPSNEAERMEMSRVLYESAVGSLMFVMICTRPNIAQAVGAASRYMANPSREHWNTIKRILRYIKGTSDAVLCYGGSKFTVRGHIDLDFAGDLEKRKSTTGYVFIIAGGAVSWVSKLQTVIALSTTKAEYMATTQACKEAIWMKKLMEELGHKQEKILLYCDSQSALHIARNPVFHSRTKHIDVQYHFVREVVEDGSVDFQKVHTKENQADALTIPINTDKYIWCRSSYGLTETFACQYPNNLYHCNYDLLIYHFSGYAAPDSSNHGEVQECLLTSTWDSWNQGRAVNLLDPVLTRVSSRSDEAIRYVHIGLLCVQENVEDRPIKDSVIMMLSSNSFILRKYNKSFVPQNSKTSTHQHNLTRFPLRKFLLGQTSKMTPNYVV